MLLKHYAHAVEGTQRRALEGLMTPPTSRYLLSFAPYWTLAWLCRLQRELVKNWSRHVTASDTARLHSCLITSIKKLEYFAIAPVVDTGNIMNRVPENSWNRRY